MAAPKKRQRKAASKKPQIEKTQECDKQPSASAQAKIGRPTDYTPELGMAICELLAEGKTLSAACAANEAFPVPRTIRRWALDPEHPFSPLYARAREIGWLSYGDSIIDTANNATTEPGQVARDRLKVDTGKWVLSKMLPKIYGDKLALTDPDGGTLKVEFVR